MSTTLRAERCMRIMRNFFQEKDRSESLFLRELEDAEAVLDCLVHVELTEYQRDALLSLLSDVVPGRVNPLNTSFSDSKLLHAVNSGEFQIAAAEFFSFCYQGSKVDVRMRYKRTVEHNLFRTGRLMLT